MALTDIAIRRARTRDKAYKIYDELGLFLIVSPSGSRLWRMKFKRHGVEKKLSFGSYPDVSLRDARKLRDEAREILAEGKDPVLERRREKLRNEALAENTFTRIAQEYCTKRRRDGDRAWAPATASRCEYLLRVCLEIRRKGLRWGCRSDSGSGCGRSRAEGAWPELPRRPSAIPVT